MEFRKQNYGRQIIIAPGEYYATVRDPVISTLLGSCVAACLYDPERKIIGMNHFLLASKQYAEKNFSVHSEAGRYGVYSMELLINMMLKRGADRRALRAKAFGGGTVVEMGKNSMFQIGAENIKFIRNFLEQEKIPLVASDLGGKEGRIIHFFRKDFSVYSKPIRSGERSRLTLEEERYWKRAVKEQEKEEVVDDIELWS